MSLSISSRSSVTIAVLLRATGEWPAKVALPDARPPYTTSCNRTIAGFSPSQPKNSVCARVNHTMICCGPQGRLLTMDLRGRKERVLTSDRSRDASPKVGSQDMKSERPQRGFTTCSITNRDAPVAVSCLVTA